ncbi:hypothetical protein T440DRAFT_466029 [Plenodomus tracheiphilus IPT5]|uniref:SprT-like domain-containing protein n=1 Tax=Plenodomus tracheiphilus IPT5 TaxID=1408161 RepID=A0A6A7BGM8_9PLEO|nr:hypothetical protein T440DRAFT_466029 [Plenodomus tracheiphilus IPT5]
MSGHAGTGQATEKRRLHPLRQIAHLILKVRKQPKKQNVNHQRICCGPTVLYNLLPFLEPFFIFDPKLRVIEDRIIGRTPQPPDHDGSVKLPSSLDELNLWVREEAPVCYCDECAPKSYRLQDERSHGRIRHFDQEQKIRSKGFSRVAAPHTTPHPELSLKLYGDYEAMRLVRHHIAWLDYTYLHPSCSKDALDVSQLRSLLHVWKPNLIASDLRSSISTVQLQHLFQQLNQVFFFGAVPKHRQSVSTGFSWLPESKTECFGISYYNPIIGTQLLLHSKLYRHNGNPQDVDLRLRNRIGTILHEMCHSFLKAYTCRSCIMHDQCVGPRGHGRAWQVLAAKIEEVASQLIGGPVDMGRFPSLMHDMESHGRLPSQHDMEVYRFGRVVGTLR